MLSSHKCGVYIKWCPEIYPNFLERRIWPWANLKCSLLSLIDRKRCILAENYGLLHHLTYSQPKLTEIPWSNERGRYK